jgi:hypothetical protein
VKYVQSWGIQQFVPPNLSLSKMVTCSLRDCVRPHSRTTKRKPGETIQQTFTSSWWMQLSVGCIVKINVLAHARNGRAYHFVGGSIKGDKSTFTAVGLERRRMNILPPGVRHCSGWERYDKQCYWNVKAADPSTWLGLCQYNLWHQCDK